MVLVLFGELFLLFLSSRKISNSVFLFILGITKSKKLSILFLSALFFPGTFIHELSHFLMAKALFVQTGKIELIPSLDKDGLKLGSVQIAQTDLLRRFLIGIAPLIVGSGILITILYGFTQWVNFEFLLDSIKNMTIFILSLYIVFVITNTMFSSKKDMEGALGLGILILFVLTVIFVAGRGNSLIYTLNHILQNEDVQNIIKRIVILLYFPLIVNILFVSLLSLMKKRN